MAPAPVDHEARRHRLTGVLLDVVAERGLEGASIRALAAAAGVSIGTVQHYFPTKDALLLHAYRRMAADAGDHAEAASAHAATPREALRTVLLELLPLDARRKRALRVGIAFAVRALHAPELAAELHHDTAELHDGVAAILAHTAVADPAGEAIAVLAFADGLGGQVLFGGGTLTAADAVALLDVHLDRVLGPA